MEDTNTGGVAGLVMVIAIDGTKYFGKLKGKAEQTAIQKARGKNWVALKDCYTMTQRVVKHPQTGQPAMMLDPAPIFPFEDATELDVAISAGPLDMSWDTNMVNIHRAMTRSSPVLMPERRIRTDLLTPGR